MAASIRLTVCNREEYSTLDGTENGDTLVPINVAKAIYKVYILNHLRSKSFNSHSIWMTFKSDFMFYVNWQYKNQEQLTSNIKMNLS